MTTSLLCFGDSNTWGAIPGIDQRYEKHERWAGRLSKKLGETYDVIEEGLSGRTTVHDDPFEPGKNGLGYFIPCLATHQPDIVLIMLGTNDLKSYFHLSANDISLGAACLVRHAQQLQRSGNLPPPKVLLVSPPTVKERGYYKEWIMGGEDKSHNFGSLFALRAKELNCAFFDASSIVESSDIDGIHWPKDQHRVFADAIADLIPTL